MHKNLRKPKIVVIGGGTGTFTVLSALRKYPVELSAVVSMADDGGSTGMLRDELGVLPPGDIRRALVALAESSQTLRDLFNYRFERGALNGHSFGNLFLTAIHKITGDFPTAVEEASKILRIKGNVIPVTLDNVRLSARLVDGTVIRGEANIDSPLGKTRAPIETVWLTPSATVNPKATQALRAADLIVIGPGDLYTSLIPNFLVRGVVGALKRSKAKKVYVANLMTKFGETHDFAAHAFVDTIETYIGKNVLDATLWNSRIPDRMTLARYRKEKAEFVFPPTRKSDGREKPKHVFAPLLHKGVLARHDPDRLGKALMRFI